MDIDEELIIVTPEDRKKFPGCFRPSAAIPYCEAKGCYCLTSCDLCKNSCPCLSKGRDWCGGNK